MSQSPFFPHPKSIKGGWEWEFSSKRIPSSSLRKDVSSSVWKAGATPASLPPFRCCCCCCCCDQFTDPAQEMIRKQKAKQASPHSSHHLFLLLFRWETSTIVFQTLPAAFLHEIDSESSSLPLSKSQRNLCLQHGNRRSSLKLLFTEYIPLLRKIKAKFNIQIDAKK